MLVRTTELRLLPLDEIRTLNGPGRSSIAGTTWGTHMTASKRIEFATRDGILLRGDFFRAENANAPIVVILGGFSLGPSSRARCDARGMTGKD
jgi:hypothetical protein